MKTSLLVPFTVISFFVVTFGTSSNSLPIRSPYILNLEIQVYGAVPFLSFITILKYLHSLLFSSAILKLRTDKELLSLSPCMLSIVIQLSRRLFLASMLQELGEDITAALFAASNLFIIE